MTRNILLKELEMFEYYITSADKILSNTLDAYESLNPRGLCTAEEIESAKKVKNIYEISQQMLQTFNYLKSYLI